MKTKILLLLAILFSSFIIRSSNLLIDNLHITTQNVEAGANHTDNYTIIKFDVSWDYSWRCDMPDEFQAAPYNYDAAWIIFKYKVDGENEWKHVWIHNDDIVEASGSATEVGLLDPSSAYHSETNPGMGIYVYRNANGNGTNNFEHMEVRWNYGKNGLRDDDLVELKAYGVEMVYIPQASFEVGDGWNVNAALRNYTTDGPYTISSESEITVGTGLNNLYYPGEVDFETYHGDGAGPIPVSFPKGYDAYYCMKYEITQQNYLEFLNSIDRTQQINRVEMDISGTEVSHVYIMCWLSNVPKERQAIRCDATIPASPAKVNFYMDLDNNGVDSQPDDGGSIGMGRLNGNDFGALADWMAMRPMTELEYEKACRGTVAAVSRENAWGTTGESTNPITLGNDGTELENVSAGYQNDFVSGNVNYLTTSAGVGPYRVGIFAEETSSRVEAGASYYGVLDLSGNLWEITISIGDATGRSFDGSHGDGLISAAGEHNVTSWPSLNTLGYGIRGGAYDSDANTLWVSTRIYGNSEVVRDENVGGRFVRTK